MLEKLGMTGNNAATEVTELTEGGACSHVSHSGQHIEDDTR